MTKKRVDSYANLLNDFFKEQVKSGKMTILEALDNQAVVQEDMKQAEIDYHNGNCEELSAQFFDDVRAMAKSL